jgi:tetratricopeptide (TPR) repeat protein
VRGEVWAAKEEFDKAIADCNEAIRLQPTLTAAYVSRSNVWMAKGEFDKAITDYTTIIKSLPNDPENYCHRGSAGRRKGNFREAKADYEKASKINPRFACAYNNLAWMQATCPDVRFRNGKEAALNARKAYKLGGGDYLAFLDTLAAACAETGDFQKAREWEAKAIEIDSDEKRKQRFRARMELYKQGKPCRDEPKMWQDLRVALVDMATAGKHEELKMALPNLRSDPIIADGDDCVTIGKWKVNVKNRTFVILVDAGPIFAEYSGVFTQGKDGAWQAKITSEKHN